MIRETLKKVYGQSVTKKQAHENARYVGYFRGFARRLYEVMEKQGVETIETSKLSLDEVPSGVYKGDDNAYRLNGDYKALMLKYESDLNWSILFQNMENGSKDSDIYCISFNSRKSSGDRRTTFDFGAGIYDNKYSYSNANLEDFKNESFIPFKSIAEEKD